MKVLLKWSVLQVQDIFGYKDDVRISAVFFYFVIVLSRKMLNLLLPIFTTSKYKQAAKDKYMVITPLAENKTS